MGPMNDPRVCFSRATRGLPLMGHTGVCNNFPRATHIFCLPKDRRETHVCLPSCWANMWLPLWGHTWAATNGAHWIMQQFSTCYPYVLPPPQKKKKPTWNPCVFAICFAHVGPICDYHYGTTHGLPLIGHTGLCNNFPRGTHMFWLSKDPHGPT